VGTGQRTRTHRLRRRRRPRLLRPPDLPPTGPAALQDFFTTAGGELKRLDPAHPLVAGVIGRGQCGVIGDDYRKLIALPAIDIATFHDYVDNKAEASGDMQRSLRVALALTKPFLVEESGIGAGANGCLTPTTRADVMRIRWDAAHALGAAVFLPWNLQPDNRTDCGFDFGPNDPLLPRLTPSP
jgi:hypothetical protein